jgi:hypothetical protein
VPQDTPLEDDDAADAWGWRDDDVDIDDAADPEPTPQGAPVVSELRAAAVPHASAIREMILSEKYWISSIPQAILTTIEKLYEDAAKLTQPEFVTYLSGVSLAFTDITAQNRTRTDCACCFWPFQSSHISARNVPCSLTNLLL